MNLKPDKETIRFTIGLIVLLVIAVVVIYLTEGN